MLSWKIGDVRITRVQELEAPGLKWLLPDATVENLKAIDWIGPYVDPDGRPLASVHALVIETPGPTVVVDTCVGNDKERSIPFWNRLQTRFLEDLEAAGPGIAAVDAVVCTHLHIDHGGGASLFGELECEKHRECRPEIEERHGMHDGQPSSHGHAAT